MEANVFKVSDELGLYVEEKEIQASHLLKDNDRAIVRFSDRKDSLKIFCFKKDLKSLDSTELDFPKGTRIVIIESLCPYYCALWNKCKKLNGMGKSNFFLHEMVQLKSKYWT